MHEVPHLEVRRCRRWDGSMVDVMGDPDLDRWMNLGASINADLEWVRLAVRPVVQSLRLILNDIGLPFDEVVNFSILPDSFVMSCN